MLARLKIVEADKNQVITLSQIGNHVNCVIDAVSNPEPGDEADVNAKGERITQVRLNPSGETRFQIPKIDLQYLAGTGRTPFQYLVFKSGSGNSEPSEVEYFLIQD